MADDAPADLGPTCRGTLAQHGTPECARGSNALVCLVGPFQLHRVGPDLLRLPSADVADLTVVVVVPALSRNRVGDGFAQLMRTGRREGIERRESARTSHEPRLCHRRIKQLTSDIVVVATKGLA